jgi:hypothetical protein
MPGIWMCSELSRIIGPSAILEQFFEINVEGEKSLSS